MDHSPSLNVGPWYQSREVGAGVTLLWEPHVHPVARCNIWHVRGTERDLLIDSGAGLVPRSPALALDPARPLIAVATHGHFDHVGALHEFGDRRAHPAEADDYALMPESLTLAHLFRELDAPVDELPYAGWQIADYRVAPAAIGTRVGDGDRIDLGGRTLTVMHLPGHSPGSIGLFDERDGMLFSGDALYDGELIDNFDTSSVEHYRATMERLRALPIRIGHGGHGPSYDEARKQILIDDYLAGRRVQGCPGGG